MKTKPRFVLWLIWSIVGLTVLFFGLGVVFLILTPVAWINDRYFFWPDALISLSMLIYVGLGALIALRRPENKIGWIFCVMGLAWHARGVFVQYMFYAATKTQDVVQTFNPIAWLPINLWVVTFGLLSLLVLLFPTGYALTSGWRSVVWLSIISMAIGLISADPAIRLGAIMLQFTAPLTDFSVGSDGMRASFIQSVSQLGTIISGIVAATSLIVRLRLSHGEERQQIKWFVYASIWLVFFVVASTLAYFLEIDPNAPYPLGAFLGIPNALTLTALPVATTIAILKYHLWDIDLIIRRTLIYSVLTAILIAIYFVAVVGLQRIFLGLIGSGSTLAVVVSTLIIAILFNPLRLRIQSVIDRRFYRRKYNIDQIVSDFNVRLHDEVDFDQVALQLIEVASETIQPEFIFLWLSPEARGTPKEY